MPKQNSPHVIDMALRAVGEAITNAHDILRHGGAHPGMAPSPEVINKAYLGLMRALPSIQEAERNMEVLSLAYAPKARALADASMIIEELTDAWAAGHRGESLKRLTTEQIRRALDSLGASKKHILAACRGIPKAS